MKFVPGSAGETIEHVADIDDKRAGDRRGVDPAATGIRRRFHLQAADFVLRFAALMHDVAARRRHVLTAVFEVDGRS